MMDSRFLPVQIAIRSDNAGELERLFRAAATFEPAPNLSRA